jgi:chromosome condensin MukBEF complex kleisin-like MukF subunit
MILKMSERVTDDDNLEMFQSFILDYLSKIFKIHSIAGTQSVHVWIIGWGEGEEQKQNIML